MTEPVLLDHILVGLVAALVTYGILRGQREALATELTTAAKLSIYWSNGALLWLGALAAGAVWLLAGRTLSDLGLTARHDSVGLGAAITLAFLVWYALETRREVGTPARRAALLQRWRRDCPFVPETRLELGHFMFLAITAGVTEEVIARGFLIAYVGWFTGSSAAGIAAAVAIPAVAFALAHRYQGGKAMARITLLAVFFGAIFVVTGSLLVPIVLHAIVDIVGGVVAYRLAASDSRSEAAAGCAAAG